MIRRLINSVYYRVSSLYPTSIARIKKSNWYHTIFPHLYEFERLERNADIICIGSTPAKYALDFTDEIALRCYNLAVCPETIFYDFQILKNYHSYLKPGGLILFVLCPFSLLKDKYKNERGSKSYQNVRYYPILHRAMIDNFDVRIYNKWVNNPLLLGVEAWKRLMKDVPPSNTFSIRTNPMSQEESRSLCLKRVKSWMDEFHLKNLDLNDTPIEIERIIEDNVNIFIKMKIFIEERGYRSLIIIPPFPEEMTSLLPMDLINHNLLEPLSKIGMTYISYYGCKEWSSRELYQHGFLLNATGRELFTKDIFSRVKKWI